MKNPETSSSLTKSQLAKKYEIGTATLKRRCRRAGIIVTNDKVLLPKQIEEIVSKLGHWNITYTEP